MKTPIIVLTAIFISVSVFAQAPKKMSYQAVIRDVNNALVTDHAIGIQISILQGSTGGTVVYTESQTTTTNANGLISIEIGGGTGFDIINWSNNSYFIETEIDPTGGTNYTIIGTSQLLSVPFALYAKKAENGFSGNYDDLINRPVLFDGQYNSLIGLPALFDGNYNSLTGKPQGNNIGDMQYWDGSAWLIVPVGKPGQFLQLTSVNIPAWAGASFPTITTTTVSSITTTTANSGGNVLNDGGASVTARGVCWSTSENPTIADSKTTDGSGTGTFTSSVTPLTPGTTYYLRSYASNSAGTAYGNDRSFTTASIVTYLPHTISLDGINDFVVADEQFSTTSSGYNAYFAWDANYFYIGYKGSDIATANSSKWLIIYLDGTPGTTTGQTLNTQTPSLPFAAKYLLMWRTSKDFFGSWVYNGSTWGTPSSVSASDYSQSNDYIEMRISRASIGNPSKLKVHINMISEASGSEWTYGGVPSTSFSDGYNPAFLHYYQFDFSNTIKPSDYVPQ